MKVPTLLTGSLLFMFMAGCALINSSHDSEPTAWEEANRRVLENLSSNPLAVERLLDNCIVYTTFSYQRNLCTLMKQQVAKGKFTAEYANNLRQVAYDFPGLGGLVESVNKCMVKGDAVATIICAHLSRSLENFDKGYISESELARQLAVDGAILKEYFSGPTFADYLLGAGRILAEGASRASEEQQQQQQWMQQQQILDELQRQRRQQFLREHQIR